jgi:hypothetical protein
MDAGAIAGRLDGAAATDEQPPPPPPPPSSPLEALDSSPLQSSGGGLWLRRFDISHLFY